MKVLVLMSTYNGELYLGEQIDSILTQKGVDVDLLVRDDGSEDKTCDILETYSKKYKNIKWVSSNNIGFVRSFSELLKMAGTIEYDYYAFSDQDDVWMPEKLQTACNSLLSYDNSLPLLFSSNSIYVDENLNKLGFFHQEEPYRTKENVMIYPTEQGCSMVFNMRAVELYNKRPPSIAWHDRWMCLICTYFGETIYSQLPLFYYRIHSKNALGENNNSFWKRITGKFLLLWNGQIGNFCMTEEFFMAYGSELDEKYIRFFNIYLNYRKSFKFMYNLIKLDEFQHSLSWWDRYKKTIMVILGKL